MGLKGKQAKNWVSMDWGVDLIGIWRGKLR